LGGRKLPGWWILFLSATPTVEFALVDQGRCGDPSSGLSGSRALPRSTRRMASIIRREDQRPRSAAASRFDRDRLMEHLFTRASCSKSESTNNMGRRTSRAKNLAQLLYSQAQFLKRCDVQTGNMAWSGDEFRCVIFDRRGPTRDPVGSAVYPVRQAGNRRG
jgi:hypothetical protein